MQLSNIDLIIVFIYFIGLVVFGLYIRKRKITFDDFSVARRSMPTLFVTLSLMATLIGPGFSVALSDKGASHGYLYFFIFSFFSLQYIFTGLYFAPKLQQHQDCHSLGDIIKKAYGPLMQKITGVVSLLLTIAFAAIMGKVGANILSGILDIDFIYGLLIVTFVGVVYTFTGGLKAVIYTEVVQAIIIIITILILLFCMLNAGEIPNTWFEQATDSTASALSNHSLISLSGLAIAFLLGEFLIPPYANRALASNTKNTAKKSFIYAGIASSLWFFIIVSIGILSIYITPDGSSENTLIKSGFEALPYGLIGLFVIALASIIMSTQESLLNAGATAFIRDLMPESETSNEKDLKRIRTITLIIAILSIFVAIYAKTVLSILLAGYAVWVPIVAIPLAWYLATGKTSTHAIYYVVFFGGAASLTVMINYPASIENGQAVFAGVIGNIIGYLASFISSKKGL